MCYKKRHLIIYTQLNIKQEPGIQMNTRKNSANLLLANLKNTNPDTKPTPNPAVQKKTEPKTQDISSFMHAEVVTDTGLKQHLTSKNPVKQISRTISREELLRNKQNNQNKQTNTFFNILVNNSVFYFLWVFVLLLPALLTFGMLYISPNVRDHFLTNDALQILWVSSLYAMSLLFITCTFYLIRNFSLLLAKSLLPQKQ